MSASKKCAHAWRVKVEMFLDIPRHLMHGLSKAQLRSSDVRIDGVNWPTARTYCKKCGFNRSEALPTPKAPK